MIYHYSALKIATLVKVALVTALVTAGITTVTDPTIKVAIIIGISTFSAAFVTGLFTIILGVMNYRLQKETLDNQKLSMLNQAAMKEDVVTVKKQTDGIFAKMTADKDKATEKAEAQEKQLGIKSDEASYEKGHRAGSDSERTKQEGKD